MVNVGGFTESILGHLQVAALTAQAEPERLIGRISSGACAPKPATEPLEFRASDLERSRKKF